jgi:hypothetical protein
MRRERVDFKEMTKVAKITSKFWIDSKIVNIMEFLV